MKTPSVAILLISILASPGLCADNAPDASSPWHVVSRTRLARVSVDSALYEQQGNSHFFVKVQIANLSSDDLFVDLRDYGKVIYPNQWGVLRTDGRRSINERRVVIAPLDEQQRTAVLAAYRKKELTRIAAGDTLEYFREFNASGRSDVQQQVTDTDGAQWVFVSMDGQLLMTDARTVEQIRCTWDEEEKVATSVLLPLPIAWETIPEKAIVVETN